jgi:hypothetical protein
MGIVRTRQNSFFFHMARGGRTVKLDGTECVVFPSCASWSAPSIKRDHIGQNSVETCRSVGGIMMSKARSCSRSCSGQQARWRLWLGLQRLRVGHRKSLPRNSIWERIMSHSLFQSHIIHSPPSLCLGPRRHIDLVLLLTFPRDFPIE